MSFHFFSEDEFSGKFDFSNWAFECGRFVNHNALMEVLSDAMVAAQSEMCLSVVLNHQVSDCGKDIHYSGPAVFEVSLSDEFGDDPPVWSVPFDKFAETCMEEGIERREYIARELRRLADTITAKP